MNAPAVEIATNILGNMRHEIPCFGLFWKICSLLWTGCFAKIQSNNFLMNQDYPSVDDFEGKKRLYGV